MIVCCVFSFWTLHYKERQALFLQKILLAFPTLKALHTLIVTTNIALCSDQELWETANKYMIMGLISFETLFHTVLLTMFFVVAKGWGVVRFYVLREEATHVTIALGAVYLHYSAFFVTIELPTMNKVVKVSKGGDDVGGSTS